MGQIKAGDEVRFCQYQNRFNRALNRYVNKGVGQSPAVFIEQYQSLKHIGYAGLKRECELSILPYQGTNTYVHELKAYLKDKVSQDLFSVLVHGSVGTYEEMAYSDFDALVILSDRAFQSPSRFRRVSSILRNSLKFMYRFDPLQHHGWFVLTEFDLSVLSEAFFPAVLFDKSKDLLNESGNTMQVAYRSSEDETHKQLESLLLSIRHILDTGIYRKNMFYLKSLLSQFMLIPALYLQAKEGKGVWKGDSFERAKNDFSGQAWAAIEQASALRGKWAYPLSATRKTILTQPGWVGDKLRKSFSPSIPAAMFDRITPVFIENMYGMTEEVYTNANLAVSV